MTASPMQLWRVLVSLCAGACLSLASSAAAANACDFTAAVKKDDISALKALLDRGCDPNHAVSEESSPLYQAVMNGRRKAVRLLLARGADPNASGLLLRLTEGTDTTTMQMFLDHGARVNDPDEQGDTALHKAANPAARDRLGRSALHALSDDNAADRLRAEFLVCHGADPKARDLLGWTASDLAAIRGWPDASPVRCGNAWQQYHQRNRPDPKRPRMGYMGY
jgi:ankyrin repeat protein